LKLGYKGSVGYLGPEARNEIIAWLREQNKWDMPALQAYVKDEYDVVYKSKQSYYDLFKAAGISWKKAQKVNPKKDPEAIAAKRGEIDHKVDTWAEELATGKRVLFFQDECHLLWGNVCGYVWGPTNRRIEIPITNEKQKQTYYGALNYLTGQALVRAFPKGISEYTTEFLKYLVELCPEQKIGIIWDGASYHKSAAVRDYLDQVNQGLPEDEWKITCILLAPHAPEQNPMEDVWLQGKNAVRKSYDLCASFANVKEQFVSHLHQQVFDFPKLRSYRQVLQLT
jgi:transposase